MVEGLDESDLFEDVLDDVDTDCDLVLLTEGSWNDSTEFGVEVELGDIEESRVASCCPFGFEQVGRFGDVDIIDSFLAHDHGVDEFADFLTELEWKLGLQFGEEWSEVGYFDFTVSFAVLTFDDGLGLVFELTAEEG